MRIPRRDNLRPADSRLDYVERRLGMSRWRRADDGQLAPQDIDQLRKLINAGLI